MPSLGNENHQKLRALAIQKVADTFGEKVRDISVESVKFEVSASLGSYRAKYTQDAERQLFPDIYVILADGVQKRDEYRPEYTNPKILVIECEQDARSTLISGKPSLRRYAYQFLKEKYKDELTFILVTWDDIKVHRDATKIWDEIWQFDKSKGGSK